MAAAWRDEQALARLVSTMRGVSEPAVSLQEASAHQAAALIPFCVRMKSVTAAAGIGRLSK